MSSSILSLADYSVVLNEKVILNSVNCSIPKGQITTVVGPSGSGKSTLLRSVVKLIPHQGSVTYADKPLSSYDIQQLRREVVYVAQKPVVFPGTVADNIRWGQDLWSEELINPLPVSGLMDMVGLESSTADQDASSLSGGQQQRLHLARSLGIRPKVLLLDEPASSLDAISKEKFEQLIQGLLDLENDLTIVLITHDLQQAKRMADYALLIVDGDIQLEGPASSFFEEMENKTDADILRELINREDGNDD